MPAEHEWFRVAWLVGVGIDEERCFAQEGCQRAWTWCKVGGPLQHPVLRTPHGQANLRCVGSFFVLQGAPGVYLHRDDQREKADHYCRFVKFVLDGLRCVVEWAVMVNRQGHAKVS